MAAVKLTGSGVGMLALLLAGTVAAVWLSRKLPELAASINTDTINPTSRDNIAYRGVNAVGDVFIPPLGPGRMGDGSWSLGAAVYDVIHGMPTTEPEGSW